MKKKIGIILISILLIATVTAFSIGDLPPPPVIANLLTQSHDQYGQQFETIDFDVPMTEEGMVISCDASAYYNAFHITGGRADCVPLEINEHSFGLLITYDYDYQMERPDTFKVRYLVKNDLGEERFDVEQFALKEIET